jgi:hypothetical protein
MENELIKQLKEKLKLFPSDDEGLYQRGLYDGYLNSINLAESIDAELNDKYQEIKAENQNLINEIHQLRLRINNIYDNC